MGGGKSLQGVYSYYDAVHELSAQIADIEEVFIACGTGTTLTGICAGMQKIFPQATVHAISVARTYAAERNVLEGDMKLLNIYLGTSYDFSNLIFHDEFLCGGYGCATDAELSVICECVAKEGMILDPTYVGKAFYGMDCLLVDKSHKGKKILFWNTGGLINLLSQRNVVQI